MRSAVPRSLVVLTVLLTITATTVLGSINDTSTVQPALEPEDDGGSGGDAPAEPGKAVRLNGPGPYKGSFKSTDSDWYVHGPGGSDPACVELTTTGVRVKTTDLRLQRSEGTQSVRLSGPGATIGYATRGVTDVYAGFVADESKGGSNKYEFATAVKGLAATMDGGSTGDAGPDQATAAPLGDGCVGGIMAGSSGDARDVFSFTGASGDQVVFTFLQASSSDILDLTLVSPAGTSEGTTASGGKIAYTLGSAGVWYLVVEKRPDLGSPLAPLTAYRDAGSAAVDIEYTIGSCKPFCLVL